MGKMHIIGGGTFSYIRTHLSLAVPAFGRTATALYGMVSLLEPSQDVSLHLTKMCDGGDPDLITNNDVFGLVETLKADPETRIIIMNAALCDYEGSIGSTKSGKHATRLKSREGQQTMILKPASKLISTIRKDRKDIFVVGFKTTAGATPDEQYLAGLNMLKESSINLVLANDVVTHHNMVIAPEETRYFEGDRSQALMGLIKMVLSRSKNQFTRSTVIPGQTVPWQSDLIPANLRAVVDHCIARGAYKPFRGSTAGHFAVRLSEGSCLTSKRKTNYNNLQNDGLVRVDYDGLDKVIAHGFKPSVGGQSQRIVFTENPDLDNIVHFHCPVKEHPRDIFPIDTEQAMRECGSTQCGKAVADNLPKEGNIRVVMLDNHGPNIVFSKDVAAAEVIDFIEANFNLEEKTGGLLAA